MAGDEHTADHQSRRQGRSKTNATVGPGEQLRKLRTFRKDLEAELAEETRVWEGDREVAVSKQRGVVKMLVRKALGGDMRAAATIVTVARGFDGDEVDEDSDESDRQQLKQIVDEEIARRGKASAEGSQ